MIDISQRMNNMEPSATLALSSKVAQMKRQKKNIIAFNLGEPDFNTPENIIEKGIEALNEGITKYTPAEGALYLREAISHKLLVENHINYMPCDILVTNGAKQALFNAIMAICNKGDEILVPTPCWVSYIEMIKLAGGVPKLIPMNEKDGFSLDVSKIESAITNKTKALIINSPNNPTGAVYNKDQLERLGHLAVTNNFLIISDEIYEKLIYEDYEHISISSLSQEIKNHTLTVNGVSKTYAMTGWRIGYAAGPSDIIKAMVNLQSHTTSNANSPSQYASVEALTNTKAYVVSMREEFGRRRNYMVNRLNDMEGITCISPKGAFYAFPNVEYYFGKRINNHIIKTPKDLAEVILMEGQIAVVPGEAFYAPNNLRISYSNSIENISMGMDKMERVLKKLV